MTIQTVTSKLMPIIESLTKQQFIEAQYSELLQ